MTVAAVDTTAIKAPLLAVTLDDLLLQIDTAYRYLANRDNSNTFPHRSWGDEMSGFMLSPLDYTRGLHLVKTGLELLAGPGIPSLRSTRYVASLGGAGVRATDAMCAHERASSTSLLLAGDEGFQSLCFPLLKVLREECPGYDANLIRDTAYAFQWSYIAIVARARMGFRHAAGYSGPFTAADYDLLTLPWRCRIGPLHPDDDNDVCTDPVIENNARRIQQRNPAISRDAARVQAALQGER